MNPEVKIVGVIDILAKYKELGLKLVDAFSITVAIACIVFTFICLFWYARVRIASLRKRLRKELGVVDYSVHKALSQLYFEVTSHVKNIDKAKTKRELTAEEAVFMDRFEHRLSHIESMLNNEMERIEKDIRKL